MCFFCFSISVHFKNSPLNGTKLNRTLKSPSKIKQKLWNNTSPQTNCSCSSSTNFSCVLRELEGFLVHIFVPFLISFLVINKRTAHVTRWFIIHFASTTQVYSYCYTAEQLLTILKSRQFVCVCSSVTAQICWCSQMLADHREHQWMFSLQEFALV